MKEKEKYIKQVRQTFEHLGKDEKTYLKKLEQRIDESDFSSYSDLVENFGEPKELVTSYYEFIDESDLAKKIKKQHMLRWIIAISAIVAAIVIGVVLKSYFDTTGNYIDKVEIEVSE